MRVCVCVCVCVYCVYICVYIQVFSTVLFVLFAFDHHIFVLPGELALKWCICGPYVLIYIEEANNPGRHLFTPKSMNEVLQLFH